MQQTVRRSQSGEAAIKRCPGCGHRLAPPVPPHCPLCDFDFRDDRVTGADVTPYSRSFAQRERGYRRMCEWVWFAAAERLKHIALMRASAASTSFHRANVLILALALGITQATAVGFRWVASPAESAGSTLPTGDNWMHVVSAPDKSSAPADAKIDLWWNPAQAGIALATGMATAWLLLMLLLGLIRAGMTRAHERQYRDEMRMTAALHYSTAWWLPLLVGVFVLALRVLSHVGGVARWSWCPPASTFVLAAGVIAGFAVVMWWFWLIRLGSTAPPTSRSRVTAFLAIGVPLITSAIGCAWWFGLVLLHQTLFRAIKLEF